MATKRVLAIHDMCSFGRCSLTAAIPVISAMGFQVCPFPTAIFSNNLTYGDYTFSDFTPHMTEFMDKWQKLGYSYDAIYSGFLADAGQIAIVLDAIARFAKKDTLVVVDPAMADDGKLYPVFKPILSWKCASSSPKRPSLHRIIPKLPCWPTSPMPRARHP